MDILKFWNTYKKLIAIYIIIVLFFFSMIFDIFETQLKTIIIILYNYIHFLGNICYQTII